MDFVKRCHGDGPFSAPTVRRSLTSTSVSSASCVATCRSTAIVSSACVFAAYNLPYIPTLHSVVAVPNTLCVSHSLRPSVYLQFSFAQHLFLDLPNFARCGEVPYRPCGAGCAVFEIPVCCTQTRFEIWQKTSVDHFRTSVCFKHCSLLSASPTQGWPVSASPTQGGPFSVASSQRLVVTRPPFSNTPRRTNLRSS